MEIVKAAVLALIFAGVAGLISVAFPGTTAPRILIVGVAAGVLAFAGLVLWDRWRSAPSEKIGVERADATVSPARPSLRIAPQLEEDSQCFRLRVFNDAAVRCEPRVIVSAVSDDRGKDLLPAAQAPIELAWTHRPDGERASLAKSDVEGETVAVFWVRQPPVSVDGGAFYVVAKELLLYGMHHRPLLARLMNIKRGSSILAHLIVSCPDYPTVERIECDVVLIRDTRQPLGFRSTVKLPEVQAS